MIKIQPTIKTLRKNSVLKSFSKHIIKAKQRIQAHVDLSGEEQGYYKVSNKLIKVIFPR